MKYMQNYLTKIIWFKLSHDEHRKFFFFGKTSIHATKGITVSHVSLANSSQYYGVNLSHLFSGQSFNACCTAIS